MHRICTPEVQLALHVIYASDIPLMDLQVFLWLYLLKRDQITNRAASWLSADAKRKEI